jgi:asparagine synthetase B (glutamine-hydrolysing)
LCTDKNGKGFVTAASCDQDASCGSRHSIAAAAATAESGADAVTPCGHTRVAVLFSGGIDSLVLAALADKYVIPNEPIDLLNVAFQQSTKSTNIKASSEYNVPDRQTGRQGLVELQSLNPCRCWNFVEINVSLAELQLARSEHISRLIYPLNTVLDDSIGCAVWFAARGQGFLNGKPYVTTARVLLVGMGADEQLAGYSRHRQRFSTNGWSGLVEEIQMEIDRISFRNLGRDDRVISDHGREARSPYLDERVVKFLCSIPMHIKADLSLPRGIGEKLLLRLAARKLGLMKGAVLPKRAIQFGSRIAKAENGSERASDVCHRL